MPDLLSKKKRKQCPFYARLKTLEICHDNSFIEEQLRQIGIRNLIKISKPAKCCRKSVLNEKLQHKLPYAPSIMSLPLEEQDLDIIKASLKW